MADLGKNGYKWSGYTEPFIVPAGESVAASQISTQDLGVTGFTGAVAIEYTEYRNAGLFVRSAESTTGTTFDTKDINFDTRMEFTPTRFIVDFGGTLASITDVSYAVDTGLYTVTVSTSVTVAAGNSYKVVAKILDVGTVAASRVYAEGEKVIEPYPFIA